MTALGDRRARVGRVGPVKVVPISLDEPLHPVRVEDRYTEVLLVVVSGGFVVGEVRLPALSVVTPPLST